MRRSDDLGGAQSVPVGEQDHRVVARAVARAFLGGAQKRGDFVAGEVIAEARFAGHANNVTATALPFKSAQRTTRVNARHITKRPTRPRRAEPLPADRFSGPGLAT